MLSMKESGPLLRCGCRNAGAMVWPESYGKEGLILEIGEMGFQHGIVSALKHIPVFIP